jgi:hypothetical protein
MPRPPAECGADVRAIQRALRAGWLRDGFEQIIDMALELYHVTLDEHAGAIDLGCALGRPQEPHRIADDGQ